MLQDIKNFVDLTGMPKCDVDRDLHEQVQRFISENVLTKNGAAMTLGVGRTTFWRFCKSGKARGDTRDLYRSALAKRNKGAAAHVADDAADADMAQRRLALHGVLAGRELKQIRKVCEGVLALIDVYEAQSLGRKC